MTTTTTPDHVAWLLNADGTVTPLAAVRRMAFPGSARVTLADGTTRGANVLNVLSRDDLDRRYRF